MSAIAPLSEYEQTSRGHRGNDVNVQGFGCRPARAVRHPRWPASESRQRTNPRRKVRGECRALGYGDLTEAEGVSAGAQSPSSGLMTHRPDSGSWVCWSRLSLRAAVADWLRRWDGAS